MAADYTYTPILAVDAVTTAPVGGVTGTVTDAETGGPVTTYNMGGVATPLVTNARGYIPYFKASAPRIAVAFGSLTMEKEAIENDSRIIDEAVAANTASLTSTFIAFEDVQSEVATALAADPTPANAAAAAVDTELANRDIPTTSIANLVGQRWARKFLTGQDTVWASAGDSTTNERDEWYGKAATLLGAYFPNVRIPFRYWADSTKTYGVELEQQSGATTSLVRGAWDTFDTDAADIVGLAGKRAGGAGTWGSATGLFEVVGGSAVNKATAGSVRLTNTLTGSAKMTARAYVTVDYTGAVADGTIDAQVRIGGGDTAMVMLRVLRTSAGAWTWGIYKNAAGSGVVAISTGTSAPLTDNSVQTFTMDLTLDGLTVTGVVNNFTRTGTITQAEADAIKALPNLWINAGAPAGKVKFNEAYLDNTVVETPTQTLLLYGGAWSGTTLDYQLTNLATLYPSSVHIDVLWVCSSHNYGTDTPTAYLTKVAAFLDAYRAAHPESEVILSSQNPELPPAANRAAHAARNRALPQYAADNGFGYVPAWEAFQAAPNKGAGLVLADGIHPTVSWYLPDPDNGAYVWAQAALDYLRPLLGLRG